MKRILALLLLSPALSFGQLLEVSLKGGIVTNNIGQKVTTAKVENPLGYAGSLSVTAGLPFDIRAGIGISIYKVSYTSSFSPAATVNFTNSAEVGQPLIPIEAIIVKRLNVPKLSFDLGITGGICANNKTKENAGKPNEVTFSDNKTWFTYGFVAGGQFNVSKKFSIGLEAQPKWMNLKLATSTLFLTPFFVKACVRI